MPLIEFATVLAAIAIGVATYYVVTAGTSPGRLLTPPLIALLLVANLVPVIALLVLIARRVARRRARFSEIGGGGQLHVRLVAIFSVIASVPTLLVVIFASLLFQYGVEFWFSDRARTVLENADRVAQAYVDENKQRITGEIVPMAGDIRNALAEVTLDDPRFSESFAFQVAARVLSEAAILTVGDDGVVRLIGGANLDARPLDKRLPAAAVPILAGGSPRVVTEAGDRVEAVILLDKASRTYLYVSRLVDPAVLKQAARASSALTDYRALQQRARTVQLCFNAALLLVSLLIVAAAIWIALAVADRLVRPVRELVAAARAVAGGDLAARVPAPRSQDEVGTLGLAFNRMTRRLEEQTGALVSANSQIDSRRALIEAVLSGVSAGVLSVDRDRRVRIANSSAAALLRAGGGALVGRRLIEIAPELEEFAASGDREGIIQLTAAGDPRTLAVRLVRAEDQSVLTFDDITQQLLDQRRAAWADVARRIAHEIKNPLTPIQLAAERLQRRYAKEVTSDPAVFERLTQTIVRQVGDLRRMVDEFSSFARMPKPVFRPEAPLDIARQAITLHEVAHPAIRFELEATNDIAEIVCDRRQLAQALLNVVKNAVEAIEAKPDPSGTIRLVLQDEGAQLIIELSDDGIGLPPDRDRLTEPYVTTRARGTGLGLAIVKKIVEEHFGTMSFLDRSGGGTVVRIMLDRAVLAPLASGDPDPLLLESA